MLNLLFQKGFPEQYMGLGKAYVFEVILNDGSTCQAFVVRPDGGRKSWRKFGEGFITDDQVLGWRETYNCNAARQDIDSYARNPISIVTKDHLDDAFRRHIERAPCPDCKAYYEQKTKKPTSPVSAG